MKIFTRPHVAVVLAVVGLYAALLSAQLEDAFRVSGPSVERLADFRLARTYSAAGMVVAGPGCSAPKSSQCEIPFARRQIGGFTPQRFARRVSTLRSTEQKT